MSAVVVVAAQVIGTVNLPKAVMADGTLLHPGIAPRIDVLKGGEYIGLWTNRGTG